MSHNIKNLYMLNYKLSKSMLNSFKLKLSIYYYTFFHFQYPIHKPYSIFTNLATTRKTTLHCKIILKIYTYVCQVNNWLSSLSEKLTKDKKNSLIKLIPCTPLSHSHRVQACSPTDANQAVLFTRVWSSWMSQYL